MVINEWNNSSFHCFQVISEKERLIYTSTVTYLFLMKVKDQAGAILIPDQI